MGIDLSIQLRSRPRTFERKIVFIVGLFVAGPATRTPAHYHGVIAAVTPAFMGLFYVSFLPRLGCRPPPERRQRRQINLFAWGPVRARPGLFARRGHAAPRRRAWTSAAK